VRESARITSVQSQNQFVSISGRCGLRRKLKLAAAVALALPSMAIADDFVFSPTTGTQGDWLIANQWLDEGVRATRLPGTADRADIAGGYTANFSTLANLNPTARVTTLYLGANQDGPVNGDIGTNSTSATIGTGTLNMSGGTLTVVGFGTNPATVLGQQSDAASAGFFNLSGGTFHQLGNQSIVAIGQNGYGTFVISNGASALIDNQLSIGQFAGSFGTVTISGNTSFLNVNTTPGNNPGLRVGDSGTGVLNVLGGTINANVDLFVGQDNGSVGTVNQSGGLVNVGSTSQGRWAFVGNNGGSTGNYNLTGGTLNILGRLYVANNGGSTGTFNQSAGLVKTTDEFHVAQGGNTVGTYNLIGGTLQTQNNATIGSSNGALGTFNQTNGLFTSGGGIIFANGGGATGIANISGGTMRAGNEFVLGNGTGIVNQTGGNVSAQWAEIGSGGGGVGTYNISGGSFATYNYEINVSRNGGKGTVNVSGTGQFIAKAELRIGGDSGGDNGTVNLTSGLVRSGQNLIVGGVNNSVGTFNVSGGVVDDAGGDFIIGRDGSTNGSSAGFVNQSGGAITVGSNGGGRWAYLGQNGGSNGGATGIYNMSGGTLDIYGGRFYIGKGGTGTFNQTNGAVVAHRTDSNGDSNIYVGGSDGGRGVYNLSGGSLLSEQNIFIGGGDGNGNGTLTVTGGSNTSFIAGGVLTVQTAGATGRVNLNDSTTATARGLLAGTGTITNAGAGVSTLNLGAPLSTANQTYSGVITDGSGKIGVTLNGGKQIFTNDLTYTGPTVINGGTLQLGNGGTTGSLANANILDSGTLAINHSGTYSFTNQLTGTGGLLINGAGIVTLPNASYAYTGPTTINPGTNGGTLALVNANSNNITSSSSINVLSGTLDVTGLNSGAGITISNQQVLRGAGSVTGNVSFNGGAITPGNSPTIGTMTIGGNLSLLNGTATNFVLGTPGSSSAAVGVGSFVNVNGNLTLSNGLLFNPLNNSNANGQGSLGQGYYELFGYTGVLSGFDANNTFIPPSNAAYSFLNVVNAGGGGMIEVLVGALTNFTWTGAQNSNWDINTSVNWTDGTKATIFLNQYQVAFGDTNPTNGAAITNSNIQVTPAGVIPLSMTFNNNAVNYSFTNVSGSNGIGGTTGITKNGTGSVALNSANTFTGPVLVNAGVLSVANSAALGTSALVSVSNGASLQLNNNSVLPGAIPFLIQGAGTAGSPGALNNATGSNVINGSVTLLGDTTFTLNGNALTINGVLSNSTNLATGPVVTFNGTSVLNYTGGAYAQRVTTINGGTVRVTNGSVGIGTNAYPNATFTINGNGGLTETGDINVGDTGNGLGVLTLNGNANVVGNTLGVGKVGSTQGVVVMNGGTVTINGGDSRIGGLNGGDAAAVGTIDINAGQFNSHGNFQIGANGTGGLTINGGSFDQSAAFNGFPVVGRFAGSFGVLSVNNGTFSNNQPGTFLIVGEDGTGVLNVGAGGTVNVTGNGGGVRLGHQTVGVGIANLGVGGNINTQAITAGDATTKGYFNFHGGTLTAAVNNGAFMQGLTAATIYSENAYINTGSNNITINQNLAAPAGNGVTTIALASGGSGYVGTPVIKLVGGDGVGATAVPILGAGGTITGIKVTNPGTGYTVAPTATISGGGGTGASAGAINLGVNVGGSLVKQGTGTLSIGGNNSFSGSTLITEGTLRLAAGSFDANTPGLFEGLIANGTNSFDTTSTIPRQSVQLTTRYANSTVQGGSTAGGPFPNFPDNSTYGYSGILNISATNAGVFTFGKNFDDSLLLKIDGTTVLNNTVWNENPQADITLAAGTHTLELRLGQGGGGVGPTNAIAISGLGLGVSQDGGSTWQPLTDPGNGSLLNTGPASYVLPTNTPVVMSSNTTFDVNGFPVRIGSLADASGATGQKVALGNGVLTVGTDNTSTTFSGSINDTGGTSAAAGGQIVKVGTGTLTLAGNNAYTGATTINGGAIRVGTNGATGTLGSGPVFDNASLILNRTGSLAIAQNISGTGTVSHVGNGVSTLTGNNGSLSGGVSVSAGTLVAGSASALGTGNIALSGTGTLSFAPTVPVFVPSITGFGGNGANWSINSGGTYAGSNAITADVLTLTESTNGQRRSAFLNTPQNITGFTTSFVYQAGGNKAADGTTFTIQNDGLGTSALGDGGGKLGYGTEGTVGAAPPITNSISIQLNIYGGAPGGVGTAYGANGDIPTTMKTGAINLASGDPILVTLNYAGGTALTETLFDQTTQASFSTTYNLGASLAAIVGGSNKALIGFTGATGGLNADQTVSNFAFGVSSIPTSLTYGNNISLNGTPTIDVNGGLTTKLTGVMSGSGTLTKGASAGKLVLAPASGNVALPGLTVNGGTLAIGDGVATTTLNVANFTTVNTGGLLQFPATLTRATHSAGLLTLNGTGTLDLNNHDLLTTTTAATVRQYLVAGYNGGNYNGSNGGIISTAASNGNGHRALGYASSTDAVAPGVVIPAGKTLVRYTIPGDADLNQTVNFTDFQTLTTNYNKPGNWTQGDFNYDGIVNFTDFQILTTNYNTSLGATGSVATGSATPAAKASSVSGNGGVVSAAAPTLSASAASTLGTVKYILSKNDDGSGNVKLGFFAVYAVDTTADGNKGLASYQFTLTGQTVVSNFAPKGQYDDGSGLGSNVDVGFTTLRTTTANPVTGGQNTVTAGSPLVFGFGQTAGNLQDAVPGSTGPNGTPTQGTYAAQLLLAKGTFSGTALGFDPNPAGDTATVFIDNSAAHPVSFAGIQLATQDLAATPEPTSLALLGLGAVGLMARRRKVKSTPSVN
jgi:fibronectin-binding autotransporter adhesin